MKIIFFIISLFMLCTQASAELHDIDPIAQGGSNLFFWLIVGSLFLVVIIGLLIWIIFKKKNNIEAPKLPLAERTLIDLQGIQQSNMSSSQQSFAISKILRGYLGERFIFNAREQTDPQLISTIQEKQLFEHELELCVVNFIKQCEMIKFAPQHTADVAVVNEYIDLIKEVVKKTSNVDD